MHAIPTPKSSNELAEERTDLAVSRTLMAVDRTLMAWIRMALSMNSFGFTIYKLLQAATVGHAPAGGGANAAQHRPFPDRHGTVAMIMGVIEYWATLGDVRRLKHVAWSGRH